MLTSSRVPNHNEQTNEDEDSVHCQEDGVDCALGGESRLKVVDEVSDDALVWVVGGAGCSGRDRCHQFEHARVGQLEDVWVDCWKVNVRVLRHPSETLLEVCNLGSEDAVHKSVDGVVQDRATK